MKHLYYLFSCLLLPFVIGCTNSDTETPSSDITSGTYTLSVSQSDTDDLEAEITLVESSDDVIWGKIQIVNEDTIDVAIGLSETTADSLIFQFTDNRLALARTGTKEFQGTARIDGDINQATLRLQSSEIPDGMETLAKYPPLGLDNINASWPAPLSDDSVYVIDRPQNTIHLAYRIGESWQSEPVSYDTSTYEFSSIGLSPDGSTLVAHGGFRNEVVEDSIGFGQSDLFLIYFESATQIERIEILPEPVNTSNYDIFPSFDGDGHIVYSSSGQPNGNGRQDIYRARQSDEGWTVTAFSDVINTRFADTGPYLSPDNSFMLFFRNSRGQESETVQNEDILYLSRNVDGEWSEPEKLGPPVNALYAFQYGARLSPSGEFLFVTSYRRPGGASVYRIPTADINELRGLLQ